MTHSAAELNQGLVRIIRQAVSILPPITLLPQERMRLAGSAFFEAPLLVEAVCWGVENYPEGFSEVPFRPAEVRASQDRARMFFCIYASLARLARQAHDAYLFEQSRCTTQAMDVVRYGRCQLGVPHLTDKHRSIDWALREPERILAARSAARQPPRKKGAGGKRRRTAIPRFTSDEFSQHLNGSAARARPARPGGEPEKR